jgi:hypothetical protein
MAVLKMDYSFFQGWGTLGRRLVTKEEDLPDRKGGLIWYTHGSKTNKALELGCIVMKQGGNLVSALASTPQYSRLRYMPLRHVQLRI